MLMLYRPSDTGGGPVTHFAECSLDIDFGMTVAADVPAVEAASSRLQVVRRRKRRKKEN